MIYYNKDKENVKKAQQGIVIGDPGRAGRAGRTGRAGRSGEVGEPGEIGEVGRVGETGVADTSWIDSLYYGQARPGEIGEVGRIGRVGEVGKVGRVGETGRAGKVGRSGDIVIGGGAISPELLQAAREYAINKAFEGLNNNTAKTPVKVKTSDVVAEMAGDDVDLSPSITGGKTPVKVNPEKDKNPDVITTVNKTDGEGNSTGGSGDKTVEKIDPGSINISGLEGEDKFLKSIFSKTGKFAGYTDDVKKKMVALAKWQKNSKNYTGAIDGIWGDRGKAAWKEEQNEKAALSAAETIKKEKEAAMKQLEELKKLAEKGKELREQLPMLETPYTDKTGTHYFNKGGILYTTPKFQGGGQMEPSRNDAVPSNNKMYDMHLRRNKIRDADFVGQSAFMGRQAIDTRPLTTAKDNINPYTGVTPAVVDTRMSQLEQVEAMPRNPYPSAEEIRNNAVKGDFPSIYYSGTYGKPTPQISTVAQARKAKYNQAWSEELKRLQYIAKDPGSTYEERAQASEAIKQLIQGTKARR